MTSQDIKTLLHESIENINDDDFLLAIKQMLDRKYTVSGEPVLSQEQIQRIDEAKEQVRNGSFLTNEPADKLVERWPNE